MNRKNDIQVLIRTELCFSLPCVTFGPEASKRTIQILVYKCLDISETRIRRKRERDFFPMNPTGCLQDPSSKLLYGLISRIHHSRAGMQCTHFPDTVCLASIYNAMLRLMP